MDFLHIKGFKAAFLACADIVLERDFAACLIVLNDLDAPALAAFDQPERHACFPGRTLEFAAVIRTLCRIRVDKCPFS